MKKEENIKMYGRIYYNKKEYKFYLEAEHSDFCQS